MRLQIENLTFSYGENDVVSDVSLHVNRGEFVGLIGPNGSGKSTILKNIYKALVPDGGRVTLDGENLLTMSHRETALKLGVLGQENEVPFDFLVEEVVAMGRSPHKKLFEFDNARDKQVVRRALAYLGMEKMAKRNYMHLSGGEKQRVILARVIAQESDFLILDEPTNHLDISCQLQIFDLVKRLGVTVLAAIHDLNMAALYCDRLYVLKEGRIVLHGTPEEVLTPENIFEVFGVRCNTVIHPITGKVSITFIPAGVGA
ncbi:MAG TPA: ABC transporter ATP-binding protein [Clostridia bacterium]|nr:ABC transporter ATP-binding protein [Clostridia bacterium]